MYRPQVFTGKNNIVYTALLYNGNQYLLSHETPDGSTFLVVYGLTQQENGRYTWESALFFGPDLLRAYRCLEGRADL